MKGQITPETFPTGGRDKLYLKLFQRMKGQIAPETVGGG